jgi:hypothetical protein
VSFPYVWRHHASQTWHVIHQLTRNFMSNNKSEHIYPYMFQVYQLWRKNLKNLEKTSNLSSVFFKFDVIAFRKCDMWYINQREILCSTISKKTLPGNFLFFSIFCSKNTQFVTFLTRTSRTCHATRTKN